MKSMMKEVESTMLDIVAAPSKTPPVVPAIVTEFAERRPCGEEVTTRAFPTIRETTVVLIEEMVREREELEIVPHLLPL